MYYSGHGHPAVGHHPCGCSPYGHSAQLCGGWTTPCVVLVCPPAPACGMGGYPQLVPHELSVDASSSPQQAMIGGRCEVHLSLEYLADTGDGTPSINVHVTADGTTSTWSESPIPPGYQVKDAFMTVKPGAKVEVSVTQALAKLRWCETIYC